MMHLFVGRERELGTLSEALERTIQGDGSLVLVSGEAGIGKTSLVRQLAASAEAKGALVLTGAAYDLSATPPFGPWIELISRCPDDDEGPTMPGVLHQGTDAQDTSSQLKLFEGARNAFWEIAIRRPLVIIVEDLHWADQASLDLLRYLARYVEKSRILLIATYRNDELSRRHPLFHLLPGLVRESNPDRIDLKALATNDITKLVTMRHPLPPDITSQLARHLSLRSEGNPLFLLEMLRVMEADGLFTEADPWRVLQDLDQFKLPPLIHQIIEGRVARLDYITIDLLEIAAVIGESVRVDLWQQVSQADERSLSNAIMQAVEAYVVADEGISTAVRFTHALIREVLYDRIPAPRRRSLHQRIGNALVENERTDPDAVAYHFQQGGDQRAVEWLVRAGIRARGQSAWLSAADRFAAAAELLVDDHQHVRARGWLRFYAGYLLRFTVGEQSIEFLWNAEQDALAAGDELLAAFALYSRGSTRAIRPTSEMRVGLIELRQGIQTIEHLSGRHQWRSTDEQAQIMIQALLDTADSESRLETGAPQNTREPVLVPQRGVLISRLAQAGHFLESLQMGEDFVSRLASEFGETWRANIPCLDAYSGLGNDYAAVGRPNAAKHAISTARTSHIVIGDHAMAEFMTWVELNMVIIPYQTDHLEERSDLASLASLEWTRCREITVSGGAVEAPSLLIIYELEGRWREAWQLAEEQQRSHPWKAYVAQAMLIKGRLSHYHGDREGAWRFVNELVPEGPDAEPGNCYFLTSYDALGLAVNLCLDTGDMDKARAWIAARDRWLEWSGAHLWKAENLLLWASYLRATDKLAEAHGHALEALALASEPRQPLTQVRINRFLGEIGTALEHRETSIGYFEESLTTAEACTAPYERARTLLGLAQHHAATGNVEAAASLIYDIRSICQPLDADPVLQQANTLEQQLSKRFTATPHSTTLTPRELDVLRLLAEGRSNRQIADELFISTRTVERHIANIYTKIHVHNRAEATAYAIRDQLV